MLSSTLVYRHLLEAGAKVSWVDIRDVIRTDNNFRDPSVNWLLTEKLTREKIHPLFEQYDILITQGFVGCTEENESTTLGREGSDYTAAILAHTMHAESVTIWKDVESVMNADPRRFPNAEKISQLNYAEVIEMAFYGAQVIHPKTIKPLRNKNIPLLVKSFLNTQLPGTHIDNSSHGKLPPIIVEKEKQVLVTFTTRDFSFMEEDTIKLLYELFAQTHSKPNLTQRTAISFLACLDDREEKIHQLASAAAEWFEVSMEKNLSLYTVRHYLPAIIDELKQGKQVLVEQKTSQTIQWVCR
jgi:aspartate kinase